jgi:glycosyltransferase involved in cell wall biosynthesis
LIKWSGCKADKIKVIPNPLPEEIVDTPKVFYHQQPTTRDRGERIKERYDHFKLIVVGKMTDKQKGLATKYQLDIENLVHVPYEKILDAYKRCDILCFPSFYEGFGLPIIEAQAIGRPVITSNVPSKSRGDTKCIGSDYY